MPNTVIKLQPGFQVDFASTAADIAIGGGAAGGGKSWCMTVMPTAYCRTEAFNWVYFRRTYPELTGEGSLWEESKGIYPFFGARYVEGKELRWRFPTRGVTCSYQHMQLEKDAEKHKSKAYGAVFFDELTTFTEFQFWYLQSRLRSKSGVRPFLRACTNPDPDSFVAGLIDWYLTADGFFDPQKVGLIRWFIRNGDDLVWSLDKHELEHTYRKVAQSFTYIPGLLEQNTALMQLDPDYYNKLDNLPKVERERLLKGNWRIRLKAGDMFQRDWFPVYDVERLGQPPIHKVAIRRVRAWDLAATPVRKDQLPLSPKIPEVAREKDPDYTRSVLVSQLNQAQPFDFVLEHGQGCRDRSAAVEQWILDTARQDGYGTTIFLWIDPGQAGVAQGERLESILKREGFRVKLERAVKDKVSYAKTPSAWAYQKRIAYVPGRWTDGFFNELEQFPPKKDQGHDDWVDCLSGVFVCLGIETPPLAPLPELGKVTVPRAASTTNKAKRYPPPKG